MSDTVDDAGTDVPANVPVQVRMTPIRLGVLDVTLPSPTEELGDTTDGFSVRLRPVVDAYVVLAPNSFREHLAFVWWTRGGLRGRTNAAGHVIGGDGDDWTVAAPAIEITERDDRIHSWDAVAPVTGPVVWDTGLLQDELSPGERQLGPLGFSLFWTYDREVFEAVLSDLRPSDSPGIIVDPDITRTPAEEEIRYSSVLSRWGFIPLSDEQRSPAPPLWIPTLSATENRTIAELLLTPTPRGYFAPPSGENLPYHARLLAPEIYRRSGVIFDVTSPALRALYAVEWGQRCAVHLRKSTAEDWSHLHHAREVVNAYNEGAVIPDRQEILLNSFLVTAHSGVPVHGAMLRPTSTIPQPPSPVEAAMADAFRHYTWECAGNGVDRRDFVGAINVVDGDSSWRTLATELLPVARHPFLVPPFDSLAAHMTIGEQTRDALLDYFDVYRFGRLLMGDGFHTRCDQNVADIAEALGWIQARSAAILERADLRSFMVVVGAQTTSRGNVSAVDHRLNHWERYMDANTAARRPFWTEISFEDWHALEPVLKWARSAAAQGASIWQKFFEDNIKRYDFSLRQIASANLLLNTAYRHSLCTRGVSVVRNDHWTITTGQLSGNEHFRVNFEEGTVQVHRYGTTDTSVELPFRMVATEEDGTIRGRGVRERVNRFAVDVPCAREHLEHNPHIPAWLKASAAMLNAAFVVEKASQEAQRLDRTMCVEIAQGVLGVVEGVDGIYHAWRLTRGTAAPHLGLRFYERLGGGAVTIAGRLSTVLGIGMDFYAGRKILVGADEDAMNALRADRVGTWVLHEIKGGLMIGSAGLATAGLSAPAAASLGLISSSAAAWFVSNPVGWGLLVMGVTILVIDAGIEYANSNQSRINAFETAVRASISREFREDVGAERLAPGPDRARGQQVCLTRERLATLHDRLGRV